jgi:DNA-binding MarR family transcriptional regulator
MNKRAFEVKIFIKKGSVRQQVMDRLTEPKTATELAKEIGRHRSSISRVLIDLEKKGLVRCVNPEDNKFRHYAKKQGLTI